VSGSAWEKVVGLLRLGCFDGEVGGGVYEGMGFERFEGGGGGVAEKISVIKYKF